MRVLSEQFGMKGQLHKVEKNVVLGWARWLKKDDYVELSLLVNGTEVSTFKADHFQQHLVNSGFSNSGNRGFRIKTSIDLESGMEVSVVEKDTGAHLAGSPVKIQ